ncbi:MAG: glycine cleavage system protein H [Syntrophales bacterium]
MKEEASTRYPLIPEDERKCVWMTTGLISYKLCDRNYRCEFCPFDQALKNDEGAAGVQAEAEGTGTEGPLGAGSSARIGGSFFYHPDHCWVKVETAEKVRIGVDDLLTQLMTHIQVVILPQVGNFISQGECCAHIIQEDYILPVVSPLSGSIQTINPRLKKKPELVSDDPQGYGWLLTLKPENLESDLQNLLFGRKALLWYQQEEREILTRAEGILKQYPNALGPTMQDGGVRITHLRDILGLVTAEQRARILDFSVTRHRKAPGGPGLPKHRSHPEG